MNDVAEQPKPTLITYFVGGLRSELKSELKIMKPATLRQAFSAAKMFEAHPRRRHLSWRPPYKPVVSGGSAGPLLRTPPESTKMVLIVRKTNRRRAVCLDREGTILQL